MWASNGDGNFNPTSNFAGQDGTLSGYVPIVADFNRDGRADVWWYALAYPGSGTNAAKGPTVQWLSNSDGTYTVKAGPTVPTTAPSNVYGYPYPYQLLTVGDVNGDRRPDLIWIGPSNNNHASMLEWLTNPDGTVTSVANDAGTVAQAMSDNLGNGSLGASAVDFNGDGFADLFWTVVGASETYTDNDPNSSTYGVSTTYTITGGQLGLWLGNGNGTFVNAAGFNSSVFKYSQYGYTGALQPIFGDFNGDGITDILWDPWWSTCHKFGSAGATALLSLSTLIPVA